MEISIEPSPGESSIVANFKILDESSLAPTTTPEQKASHISVDLTSKEHAPSSPSSPPEKISVTLEPVHSPLIAPANTKTPDPTLSELSSKRGADDHSARPQKSVFSEPSHKHHDRPKRGGGRIILETPSGNTSNAFKHREGVKMYQEDTLYALSAKSSANKVPSYLSSIHSIFVAEPPRMTGEERKEACRKILGAPRPARPRLRKVTDGEEVGIESEQPQQRPRLVKVGGEWVERREARRAQSGTQESPDSAAPADQGADLVLGPPRRAFPSSQANGGAASAPTGPRRKAQATEGEQQAEQPTNKRPPRGAAAPTQKAGPPTEKARLVPFGRGTRLQRGEQKVDVNKLLESAAGMDHPEHAMPLDALESAAFASAVPSPTLRPTSLTDLETSLTGSTAQPTMATSSKPSLDALFSSARANENIAPPPSVEDKMSVGVTAKALTPETVALGALEPTTKTFEDDEIFNSKLFKHTMWLEEESEVLEELEQEKPQSKFARWFSAKEQQESEERQKQQSLLLAPSQPPASSTSALPPKVQSLFGAAEAQPPQPSKSFSFEEFAKTVSALPTPSPAPPAQQRQAPAPISVSMLFAASAGSGGNVTPSVPPTAPSTADELERQLLASSASSSMSTQSQQQQLPPANAALTSLFRSSAQPQPQPPRPEMPGILANMFQQQASVPLAKDQQPLPLRQQVSPAASPSKKAPSTATAQLMSLFASSQAPEPSLPPRQEPPPHPFLGRPVPSDFPILPQAPDHHSLVAELMRAQTQRMAPPPAQAFMRSPPPQTPFGGFFQPPRGMPPGVFPGGPSPQQPMPPSVAPGLERLFAMNPPPMGYPPIPQQFFQQRGGPIMSVQDLERQFSGPR